MHTQRPSSIGLVGNMIDGDCVKLARNTVFESYPGHGRGVVLIIASDVVVGTAGTSGGTSRA